MALLFWTTMALVALLSSGDAAKVTEEELFVITKEVRQRFFPKLKITDREFPPVSMAISIPFNEEENKYDLSLVPDSVDDVKATIAKCGVYSSTKLVAAETLTWPDDVELCPDFPYHKNNVNQLVCDKDVQTWGEVLLECPKTAKLTFEIPTWRRVLMHLDVLVDNHNEKDLLFFYFLNSPVPDLILKSRLQNSLNNITKILNWDNYAVVFSRVDDSAVTWKSFMRNVAKFEGHVESIGMENLFRCTLGLRSGCQRCVVDDKVTRHCFSNKARGNGLHLPVNVREAAVDAARTRAADAAV